MGKGTKKKKNNSSKNTIKNAEVKTTKNVASKTTSEEELKNDVLNEVEEKVKEDFVEAEYEEIEENEESIADDDVEIEEDEEEFELDEEIDYEENEEFEVEEEDELENNESNMNTDEEIDFDNQEEDENQVDEKKEEISEENIDYNEVIKKVAKKVDYKIKNENVKPKKEKMSLNFKDNEIGNLIKITLIVTAIVLSLYLATLAYLKKDEVKEEETEVTATIQYEEILGSKLLSQSPKEYYVFVYKEDDLYLNTYNLYISSYQYKENTKKVYRMNLDSGFNKTFVDEKSNIKGAKIEDLKFVDTTLIKVKKKKVVEVYEGKDKILEHLRSIAK
jgi:hypothetical protein